MVPRFPAGQRRRPDRAFSLVELVLVVSIIGVIAAIAIPRIGSAVTHAGASALETTLANVRKAIDVYYAEHSKYPGYDPANGSPNGTEFVKQLILYSNAAGQTSTTFSAAYSYGPYLRKPFPKNPMNGLDTVHVKAFPGDADPADGSVGWVAVLSHGYFGVSATDGQFQVLGVDINNALKRKTFKGVGLSGS